MIALDLIIDPSPNGAYAWRLQTQGASSSLLAGEFTLGNVELKCEQVSLRELDKALAHFDAKWLGRHFDENAQLQLGKHLYALVFGTASDTQANEWRGEVALRVVSADPFIQRLPWNVLTRDKVPLVRDGWHITVAASLGALADVDFPGIPRILLVCPEPRDLPATDGKQHTNALVQDLRKFYEQFLDPKMLAVVQHWHDFVQKLTQQRWDVIYFYGHGDGDDYGAALLFTLPDGSTQRFSMADMAKVLKSNPPHILYLNACRSGNGHIGSAVMHLEELVPALVVNRTDAFTAAAREQGQTFLRQLLLEHSPPHQAISSAYSSVGLGMTSVRWMTPILYQQYRQWTFPRREVYRFASRDTHWYLKLDRAAQFSRISNDVRRMIRGMSPSTLACFWYGSAQQGVNRFHERLPVELRELSPDMEMLEYAFRWPVHWHDEDAAYHQMLCEGFRIQYIQQLPGKLESASTLGGVVPLVAHCRFETLYHDSAASLSQVAGLLQWWNVHVHPHLQARGVNALLALAFELPQMDEGFTEAVHFCLGEQEFDAGMEFLLLDELEQVNEKDVKAFLHKYEVRLPVQGSERDRVISETVENARHDGEVDYEKVLLELQTIVARAQKAASYQAVPVSAAAQRWLKR